MYRDIAQWLKVRHQVLVEGISQRQIERETGISRDTIRKMLAHPHPQPYGPRSHRCSKLGPHTASIQRMLQENAILPPTARLSIHAMYERIRDQEGFGGCSGRMMDFSRISAKLTPLLGQVVGERSLGRLPG
jgi:transposase